MATHHFPKDPRQKCEYWSGVGCILPSAQPIKFVIPDEDGEDAEIFLPCACHDGGGCLQEGYLGVQEADQ